MDRIHKFLLGIGIPANLKGFDYLHDAIEKGIKDKSYVTSAQSIYYDLADEYGVKYACIERNIRTAIKWAFNELNSDRIYDTFISVSEKKGKLTNKDFIARSVIYLNDEDGE